MVTALGVRSAAERRKPPASAKLPREKPGRVSSRGNTSRWGSVPAASGRLSLVTTAASRAVLSNPL